MIELFHINIAADDKLWTVRTSNDQDFIDLLTEPHQWVTNVPKKTLADDFVILFEEADPTHTSAYLIQGIHETAAITIRVKHRTLPASYWVDVKRDLPPQRDDNGTLVPNDLLVRFRPDHLRSYTHIELGTDRDFVARVLAGAAVDPNGLLTVLNDATLPHQCEEERGTGPSPTKTHLPSHRGTLQVAGVGTPKTDFIFQGELGSTAPACNLTTGTCTDPVTNPQFVAVDTVMVKAY
jgi:hypothetical protein